MRTKSTSGYCDEMTALSSDKSYSRKKYKNVKVLFRQFVLQYAQEQKEKYSKDEIDEITNELLDRVNSDWDTTTHNATTDFVC